MDGLGWDQIAAFNLALVAALLTPGPALVYTIRNTMRGGRAAGMATGAGLAAMAALWTMLALMGLEGVFAALPWAYGAFKIGGGAYLLWLAWTTWRDAPKPIGDAGARPAAGDMRRAVIGGVLANLGNPKSALFAAAVLVVIFPPDLGFGRMAFIAANQFLVELVFYAAIALIFRSAAVSARYLRAKTVLDRLTAAALGALGLRIAISN